MIPAVMSKGVVKSGMLIDDDTEFTSPYHIDHDDRGRGESTSPYHLDHDERGSGARNGSTDHNGGHGARGRRRGTGIAKRSSRQRRELHLKPVHSLVKIDGGEVRNGGRRALRSAGRRADYDRRGWLALYRCLRYE